MSAPTEPKVTLRDLLTREAAKLTPIAAHWSSLSDRARQTSTEDAQRRANLLVIHCALRSAAWSMIGVHSMLLEAVRALDE